MNIFAKSGLITAVMIVAFAAVCLAGEPGTVLKSDVLRAGPFNDAKTVATLTKNNKVDIQKRQGGWLYVSSSKGKGWVRMLSIKRGAETKTSAGKEASGLLDVASGRAGTGKVVATTGIRGLNEEQLKAGQFNEDELKKVESYAVSKQDAERFAKKGELVRQDVPFLPEPAASSDRGGE